MSQKLKKQCRNRRNYGRRYCNWLQKPKHLLGASAAPYDFSRIFWPYLNNSDRGTSFEPNRTSFERKMTELRGFENWSQMAICDQFSNPRNSVIFRSNEVLLGSNDVPRSELFKYGQKIREKSYGAAEAPRRCFGFCSQLQYLRP